MFRIALFIVTAAILSLAVAAGIHYQGNWAVYLGFTAVANALLLSGFRKRAIYFDTFIGVFLWLGFWLKLSVRVVFAASVFREPTGVFDGSQESFDNALIVSSCGLAAFVVASFIRERWFSYPEALPPCRRSGLFAFYSEYRVFIVSAFIAMTLAVALSNIWLGIYQRGMIAQTVLPFGLNGVYKWLLQFGLASISALIIRFELELNRGVSFMAVIPPLLEGFLSSVSLLSRGMILNALALAIGGWRWLAAAKVRVRFSKLLIVAVSISAFFIVSVLAVNYLRMFKFDNAQMPAQVAASATLQSTSPLFIDRWVGIEGVLAVSSSDRLGWALWREAWQEKFDERQFSLYDRTFVSSHYASSPVNTSRNHFVNLPGVVAFFYYPGSLPILFAFVLVAAWLAAALEIMTYYLCDKNWILCSLFAQVIAYRFASFGYVPAQSHLLFGSLILNIFALAAADRFIGFCRRRHDEQMV
jgi:hypothetical protein